MKEDQIIALRNRFEQVRLTAFELEQELPESITISIMCQEIRFQCRLAKEELDKMKGGK